MSDSPLLRRSLRRLSIAALMTALCFPSSPFELTTDG